MNLRETIRGYILNQFIHDMADGDLKDDDSFMGLGLIDSTGVLELVAFLEETFDIDIGDEEIVQENLDTVTGLVALVERKDRGRRTRVEVLS